MSIRRKSRPKAPAAGQIEAIERLVFVSELKVGSKVVICEKMPCGGVRWTEDEVDRVTPVRRMIWMKRCGLEFNDYGLHKKKGGSTFSIETPDADHMRKVYRTRLIDLLGGDEMLEGLTLPELERLAKEADL